MIRAISLKTLSGRPRCVAENPTSCRTPELPVPPRAHDDVIKWKQFSRNWPFVRRIHRSPVISPHKGQWRGALMFSLICAWINDWVNNREAGDLRRHRDHYYVIVMSCVFQTVTFTDAASTVQFGILWSTRCHFIFSAMISWYWHFPQNLPFVGWFPLTKGQ